jgi:hypothetical protein
LHGIYIDENYSAYAVSILIVLEAALFLNTLQFMLYFAKFQSLFILSSDCMPFSSTIFWDVNPATLDPEAHKHFIIERIAQRGLWADWQECLRLYGRETVKNVLLQARFLDKKTLSYCSFIFDVPKEEFRCYQLFIQEPSLLQRWNF